MLAPAGLAMLMSTATAFGGTAPRPVEEARVSVSSPDSLPAHLTPAQTVYVTPPAPPSVVVVAPQPRVYVEAPRAQVVVYRGRRHFHGERGRGRGHR